MKKNILSVILTIVMAVSLLTGCGASNSGEESPQTTQSAAGQESSDGGQAETVLASSDDSQAIIEERKAKAEETGEYQKVIFAFFTLSLIHI